MRKTLLFLFLVSGLVHVAAQKKMVFEELQYLAPVNYLQDRDLQRQFLGQLNAALLKYRNTILTDTTKLKMVSLNPEDAVKPPRPADLADTSVSHLYLIIAELNPRVYFDAQNDPADSTLRKTAKTVFRVILQVVRDSKSPVERDMLDVVVNHVKGPGIGNESVLVSLMPKTFVELMRPALNTLLDPAHDIVQMTLGVTPAYLMDNYVATAIAGKPRTYTTSLKEAVQFNYGDQKQLLRLGQPVYEEILLKGKNKRYYNDTLVNAIRNTPDYGSSDYVFLKQECRDVLNDKNYLVKLVTQVNPAQVYANGSIFTNFLAGSFHLLISDNDTLASFSILRNVPASGLKQQYPARVYNGVDSSSVIEVSGVKAVWDVNYMYMIDGDLLGRKFRICYGGVDNKVKEIFYDGKLVCIAQGKFSPDAFVVFDANLSPVMFNRLLIIAFNRFME